MPARRLTPRRVDKPWGRRDLGGVFDPVENDGAPVGEIWFEDDVGARVPLLVKYIFTSERLSIQVHPDDAAARAAGYPSGKDEAWVILSAGEATRIALGTREASTREAVRAAAIDGSIVDLLDWRRVRPDEVIYNPAGTIHAIGADVALIEVQQNVDLTYRLYDYGRARDLHLDEATAVADPVPFDGDPTPADIGEGRQLLCEGAKFTMERWRWAGTEALTLPQGLLGWFVPVSGAGALDGTTFGRGECWLIDGTVEVELATGADIVFAYSQPERLPLFEARRS